MSRDDRAEFAAVPIVLALLAAGGLLLLAASTEQWAWLLVAVPVLAVGVVVTWALRSRHRPPPDMAPAARRPGTADGVHRILVVADEGLTSSVFRDAITSHAQGRPMKVFVTAPTLASRLARWTEDESAYVGARQHLDETLRGLAELGIDASGEIGAHDPIQATDDALRVFAADELLFATHKDSDANWLEQDVVEVARNRYGLPVEHVVVEAPINPEAEAEQ